MATILSDGSICRLSNLCKESVLVLQSLDGLWRSWTRRLRVSCRLGGAGRKWLLGNKEEPALEGHHLHVWSTKLLITFFNLFVYFKCREGNPCMKYFEFWIFTAFSSESHTVNSPISVLFKHFLQRRLELNANVSMVRIWFIAKQVFKHEEFVLVY